MRPTENAVRSLPDVAKEMQPHVAGTLDWVGMGEIEVPVSINNPDGRTVQSGARVTAYVNLTDPDARGIHMSRLYLHVDKSLSNEPLTPCSLRRLLKDFLDSHTGLSDRALVRIRFDHLLRRPALVSDNSGWKSYPIVLTALMDRGQFSLEIGYEVVYSSTCPCSAALARQLIQERFGQDFARGRPLDYDQIVAWLGSEQGICATPHSQRSSAEVRVKLLQGFELPLIELIDCVEQALKTPVQTAVKRVDEQAFARLNGENLMFCEDAARRVQQALDADERIVDFWVRASHFESLHPHNAVAVATKGVAGGYAGGMDAFAALR
ncbi:GTP cyclohydrolase I [Tahibacter aquaticus]|uniref:GTP cyclohydrolase FolE2 n=1 Tax=Tahibacter aquaticus TaxID=520092 RepID=A0A4R6YRT0_9GAMM|nr:GTP cyclohydrolase FolE2 [Tahibacter aquaticus]TDR40789.1 GTP cyclohydrolase I [Tahibacter aquaticus]